jgi:ligand-binding sensor domain-containing protein
MLRSALWTISILLAAFYSNAQEYPSLTIADGLSQGMVTDIMQDSRGFMWFATQDGLNLYDGYGIKVYTFYPDEEYSLSDFRISCLMEDSRGFIWVGTVTGGVNVFDPVKERFYHIKAGETPGVQTNHILSFIEDREGNILVGSLRGLDKIYAPEKALNLDGPGEFIRDSLQIKPLFTGEEVHDIFFIGDTVLLGTRNGLMSGIYPLEDEPQLWHHLNEGLTEDQKGIYYIVRDHYGQIWAVRPHGISSLKNEGFVDHILDIPKRFGIIGFDIMMDGSFVLGGKNVGRYMPGPEGKIEKIEELIVADGSNYFNRLFTDRSGLLWASTSGYGLLKYNTARERFGHLLHGKTVRFIQSDDQSRLFVVQDLDLLVIDIPTGREIIPDDIPPDLLKSHNMLFDSKGRYWFHVARGRFEDQLMKFDPGSPDDRKVYSFPVKTDKYSEIVEDSRGRIWMNSTMDISSGLKQGVAKSGHSIFLNSCMPPVNIR